MKNCIASGTELIDISMRCIDCEKLITDTSFEPVARLDTKTGLVSWYDICFTCIDTLEQVRTERYDLSSGVRVGAQHNLQVDLLAFDNFRACDLTQYYEDSEVIDVCRV